MLQVEQLCVSYDGVPALHKVSLEVRSGEIVAIVGPNGAGKTTFMRTVAGALAPEGGSISWEGRPIRGLAPHRVVGLGISLVPEGRRIFGKMSIEENLHLGGFRVSAAERADLMAEIFDIFPRLKERRRQKAGTLSGGEQQMLAIARALMSRPRLLMLDEPSLGLAPALVEKMFEVVREINGRGVSVLLVEQDVRDALELSRRGYVLQNGRIVLQGSGRELLENQLIKEAYLGM
ncbi:MAG: ABC transporter ATP-binding protein [Actinobacteria bacterium]|nr:ABC transporter ATP-binding protein [Actinomycetota bacterium]